MDIKLNEKNVRAMANRLRKSVGGDRLSQGKALETLSQALGYKNWDTFSGLLKREDAPGFKLTRPVTLYVGCYPTDEFGEGPNWAKVTVNQAFVDQLLKMQQLCEANGLIETEVSLGPDEWQYTDEADRLSIRGEDLCVGQRSWWFRGRPKHCDYSVETRMMDIDRLLRALRSQEPAEYLVWFKDVLVYDPSGQPQDLLEMVVDSGELPESYLPA